MCPMAGYGTRDGRESVSRFPGSPGTAGHAERQGALPRKRGAGTFPRTTCGRGYRVLSQAAQSGASMPPTTGALLISTPSWAGSSTAWADRLMTTVMSSPLR
jgi:hypothetical protein